MSRTRHPVTLADMDRVAQQRPPLDDRDVHQVPVDQIVVSPKNPRLSLDAIDELAASLAAHGLLQPIVVRTTGQHAYEVIAGHRRYAAAVQLGWQTIACVVREAEPDEAFVLTLVENLQRDDLSAREEAAGLEMLVRDRRWSTRQVADAVKRSQSFVSKRLRVFEDPVLAPYVLRDEVPTAVAEELLTLGRQDRQRLAEQAAANGWNTREARKAVSAALQPHLGRRPHGLTAQIRELRKALEVMIPTDYTDADRKELQLLFKVAQFDVTRYLRNLEKRRGPVIPTIAPSGKVYVAENETEPELAEV